MTPTTLVIGKTASNREAAIAAAINFSKTTAVLFEGFPQESALFEQSRQSPNIKISYIAAGCLCCTGNLVMRVSLNRILRDPPDQLFISLANIDHLEKIKALLKQPPYEGLLALTDDLQG